MTWAEYYERYDGWQESTQYSRLASITNFGPDESPSEEISDCIQYVDTRTATSILRRALAAGVRFQTSEVVEIADSGQVEDEDALSKLIQTSVYKGYKQDKIEMRGDRAEMSDFPLYLNMVAGGLDRRDQAIGGFSFVVKIYAVPVVEIIG